MQIFHGRSKIIRIDASVLSIKGILTALFDDAGLEPAEDILSNLNHYISELESWNKRINLTGITKPEEMALKHVGDTIVLALNIPDGIKTVLDIGTGAGIPGLVLKLIRQDLDVVLLDAVRKKVSFLRYLIAGMGLTCVWAEHGRAGMDGVPAQRPHAGFDLIVSQAVGPVDDLAGMSDRLLAKDGMILSLKGLRGDEELEVRRPKLLKMGWDATSLKTYTPLTRRLRHLIFIKRAAAWR